MINGFEDWGDSQPFIYGGNLTGKYFLQQVHFHWSRDNNHGSEHTVEDKYYPAEVSTKYCIIDYINY